MGGSRGLRMRQATLDRKLRLYESAVQQPLAEVAFLERVYAEANPPQAWPRTLREDFAGTSSVAAAWCRSDPDREAIAVDAHRPTVAWAERTHAELDTLYLVPTDVLDFRGPRVDVIAALNFSVLIWHERAALVKYFRHARRGLAEGGVFVMDLFGGPDATAVQTQDRPITDDAGRPATYRWEQRTYSPLTARIDCRIHFRWPDGTEIRDAFAYDWRLWTVPELLDALRDAGFDEPQVWAENPKTPGRFTPTAQLPGPHQVPAWLAYLTARR